MDVRVRYLEMPLGIRGFTIRGDYDSYDIYLNPEYCYESQVETYEHEMAHIINGDFDKEGMDINEIERR